MLATSVSSLFVFMLLITANGGEVSLACLSLAIALIALLVYIHQLCSQRPTTQGLDPLSQRRRASLLKDGDEDSVTR